MEKKIFSFLFNTVFYSGIPKETIRMPFRGLTMLKSCKLVIKGGLCYRFAMVEHCPDLLVISYMGVQQVVCSRGPFVQSFLDRLNQESFDKMLIRPALELCCVIVFVVGVDQIIFILRS